MIDVISAGARIIRNRKTSTVLHIENSYVKNDWSQLLVHGQDENQYHDQQIWWIEPLPDYEDEEEEGIVFSITNPYSGRALDLNADNSDDERPITTYIHQGVLWQMWRLKRYWMRRMGITYYTTTLEGLL